MTDSTPPATSVPDSSPPEKLSEHVAFRCKQCGAQVRWDPEHDALHCDYCGAKLEVPRSEARIVERPLSEAGTAARGVGVERRASRCQQCGAVFHFDSSATSQMCVFCGSPNVLEQEANRNAIRPESLIPLDVGRSQAEQSFRTWIRRKWFRPSALQHLRQFDAIGVYVPCWTFDAAVHSDWSADAGFYYYETQIVPVMINGKLTLRPRQVRKVRWQPAWGARDDGFDDLLIHASKGLPEELARELGEFDLEALVPYRPEYLAGWRAEEYQLDLAEAWTQARERIVATQEKRCSGDVPGDTQRDLRVSNDIRDAHWKHILLPVWTLAYRHSGKSYTVLVHGQNGHVVGRAPLSWAKVLLFVGAVIATVLALLLAAGVISLVFA